MANDGWRKTYLQCGHDVLDRTQAHYCSYLSLDQLLGLQLPYSASLGEHNEPKTRDLLHPDEFQFITVHQMSELTFTTMIFELNRLIQAIDADVFDLAKELANRLVLWTQNLRTVTASLRSMTTQSFLSFRSHLAPASGAESIQFRIVELLSGLREDSPYVTERGKTYRYREWLDRAPDHGENDPKTRWWTEEMSVIAKQRSVAIAFDEALTRRGRTLESLYEEQTNPFFSLRQLANKLYYYDFSFVAMRDPSAVDGSRDEHHPRMGHYNLASMHLEKSPEPGESMCPHAANVASKGGTGHTSGLSYLKSVAQTARFFPKLWKFNEKPVKQEAEIGWR